MKPGTLIIGAGVAAFALARRRQLTRSGLTVLTLAALGALLLGSGLVHPPGAEQMIRDTGDALGGFTYLVVGGFAFAESGAFIGLVAPGELVVIFGGVTASHGVTSLPGLVALVWACAFSGDLVSYALGRRCGRGVLLRHGHALGITAARLDSVEGFLHRHGPLTILIGRFIGVVRALAPFVAGASRMSPTRFIPVSLIASGTWAAVFTCLGYACGESLDTLIPIVERVSIGIAVAAALAVLVSRLRRGGAGGGRSGAEVISQ